MDDAGFDGLVRRFGEAIGRRSVLGLAAGIPLGLTIAGGDAAKKKRHGKAGAEKKKHKKGKKYCLNGQTVSSKKKKKYQQWVNQGATAGPCGDGLGGGCTPNCPASGCGSDDGCGGICGCGAGSVCTTVNQCAPCDVQCSGSPAQCGDALRAKLATQATVYICPGVYGGNFDLTRLGARLAGAGSGTDPASNTILDAQGAGATVHVTAVAIDVRLERLRVTGGRAGGVVAESGAGSLVMQQVAVDKNLDGGGIESEMAVILLDCDVTNNTATTSGSGDGLGGGMHLRALPTRINTINNTRVTGNTSELRGGGIYVDDSSLSIVDGTRITGNKGLDGGGVRVGTDPANPNQLTVQAGSNISGNKVTSGSPQGAGIVSAAPMNIIEAGTVSGNTLEGGGSAPQCGGSGSPVCP